jgi:hypothetical protein
MLYKPTGIATSQQFDIHSGQASTVYYVPSRAQSFLKPLDDEIENAWMHGYSIRTSLLSNLRSLVLFWSAFLPLTHLGRCHSNEHWKARRPHDSGRFRIQFRVEESFHFTQRLTVNHLRFGHAINTREKTRTNTLFYYGMRQTLRRSCAACAKSKIKCDLRTPRCSRCTKRNIQCAYANEPLTATLVVAEHRHRQLSMPLRTSEICDFGSVDPFDSYPPTRLAREHAQRLIHTCTLGLCKGYIGSR